VVRRDVSQLEVSVAAGDSGPVVVLSGEADLTTVAGLSDVLTAQVAGGAQHLTVDVCELRFADSASIRALALAARTLKDRGGVLELLRPRPIVARALSLMGVDKVITVRAAEGAEAKPEGPLPAVFMVLPGSTGRPGQAGRELGTSARGGGGGA
jgi:anti-anti-sigma factor